MQGITHPAAKNTIYISRLTGVETVAAFMLKVRSGDTTTTYAARAISHFQHDFDNQYQIMEVTEAVIAKAMALVQTHKLRAYDGVQLAVALELNDLALAAGMSVVGVSAVTLVLLTMI